MNISILKVPTTTRYNSFKIRSKQDAKDFVNGLSNGVTYYMKYPNTLYVIEKDDHCVSVCMKQGDLRSVLNPMIELANTNSSSYEQSVYDIVYQLRKLINEKWFGY